MARSKHTVPSRIRGPSRVLAPFASRHAGDARLRDATARALKELGVVVDSTDRGAATVGRIEFRIVEKRPRMAHCHPATKADVRLVLESFGGRCTYGVRSVELARGQPGGQLRFGSMFVPGRIVLYDQPEPPWVLLGTLTEEQETKLTKAGAQVEREPDAAPTKISWPGETLRDFMLFDVLMHEIGHHMIQQYKGKRDIRVARSRDHEEAADRFADQCRIAYFASQGTPG